VSAAAEISDGRAEVARWVICFVLVVAAHGLGATALFNEKSEASDFGVNVPVVIVDLPESYVPRMAPDSDRPPGPLQEQTELIEPKEETKPPEPEAELKIPIPEPPKPDAPDEVKQATAPPPANAPRAAIASWQNQLIAHIEDFKRYPDNARGRLGSANPRGRLGSAKISFTIDHEGHVLSSRIIQSSGSAELDDEALATPARAQPLPRPPDQISDADLTIIFQMNFTPSRSRRSRN